MFSCYIKVINPLTKPTVKKVEKIFPMHKMRYEYLYLVSKSLIVNAPKMGPPIVVIKKVAKTFP